MESLRTDRPTSEVCTEQEHSMSRAQTSLVQFYLAFLFIEKLPFIPLHIKEEAAYHKFSVVKPVS